MTYTCPSAIKSQVPHLGCWQGLVPSEFEEPESCCTLTSFFLREDPVLLTKLKRDFFLGVVVVILLPKPEVDSEDEKLLEAESVVSTLKVFDY